MPETEIEQEPLTEPDPVTPPEASPADELVKALAPRPNEDEERELSNRIMADFRAGLEDRHEWEIRLAEWEDQYYGRVPDKEFPWPGASNFHVPITMTGVETFKPRLIEAVLGQTPPLIVVPVDMADEDRKDRTESFLNWQILTELDIAPIVAASAHLFLIPGIAIAKTSWRVKRVRRKFVREFPLQTDFQAILDALFGANRPSKLHQTDSMTWEGEIPASPQGGEDLSVLLRIKVLEDGIQILLEKDELIEGPYVEFMDPIDFIAPTRGGEDVQGLPWCQHRLWMYEDELRRKVLAKRFYPDRVEELLTHSAPQGDEGDQDSKAYKQSQAEAEGRADQGPSDVRLDQFDIIEDYRRWDIDEDGLEEEIITWVSPKLQGRILGWDYLDNVYAHGRRPFRVGRFFPIPFRFYPLSFAEVVKPIQDEINTIHNQRVDFATITNLPFWFYRASMIQPPIQLSLKPGTGVPVDNPQQDLLFPRWQGSPAWGQYEEAMLQQLFERLTGLTDLTLGRQPNRVGATRTAAGTQTLIGEAGLRFKTAMESFQRLWIGIFEDVLALDQEYLPPGKEFRVTGKRPELIRLKDRTEIRGRYDLRLVPTTESLNRQQMRQDASAVLQLLMNPVLLQAGLVGLKGIKRAMSDFLKAFGKDPDGYLEPKDIIRSPEEELALFVSGVYVSPTQGEDLTAHMAAHQVQAMDPDLVPFMKPEVREKLSKHMQETAEMQRGQQMAMMLAQSQGAAQPPSALQAGNVQQGQTAPQPQQPAPNQQQATNLGAQGMGGMGGMG